MLSSIDNYKGSFCVGCFLQTENLANIGASTLDYLNNMDRSEETKEEEIFCFFCEQRGLMVAAENLFEGQPCCFGCRQRKKNKYNTGVSAEKVPERQTPYEEPYLTLTTPSLRTRDILPVKEDQVIQTIENDEIINKSRTPDKFIERQEKRRSGRKLNTFTGNDFKKMSSMEKSPIIKSNIRENN